VSAPAVESPVGRPRRRSRREVTAPFLAGILVVLLAFQFLLGSYLNLYVTIPSGGNLGALPLDGLVVLILHILLGIMVIVTSLRMALVAVKGRNGREIAFAGIAALGMIVAFLGGADFTFGSPSNGLSFIMAVGFALGVLGSGLLMARAHLPRPRADSRAA
jgi:hypothetical protein